MLHGGTLKKHQQRAEMAEQRAAHFLLGVRHLEGLLSQKRCQAEAAELVSSVLLLYVYLHRAFSYGLSRSWWRQLMGSKSC